MGLLAQISGVRATDAPPEPDEPRGLLDTLLPSDTPTTPTTTPAPAPAPAPEPTGGLLGTLDTPASGGRTDTSPGNVAADTLTTDPFAGDGADVERGFRVVQWIMENDAVPVADEQQMRDMVGALARIYKSGDEEAKAAAESIMLRASDIVPDEMWEQYGLARVETTESGLTNFGGRFIDNAKGTGGQLADWGFGDNPFGNYVGRPAATALSHAQQAALTAASAAREGRVGDAAMILAEAVAEPATLGKIDTEGQATDRELARWDLNEDGIMDFAEMLGYDPNSSGRGGRIGGVIFELANFVGGELFDPLNYLTLGGSAAAGGLDVAEELYGVGARQAIERQGLDAVLDATEQKVLRDRIRESLAVAFGEEGRRRTAYEVLRRMDPEQVADKRVQEALRSIQDGRGVHFAGMRLPGSEAVQNIPGRRRVEYAGRADELARRELIHPDPENITHVDRLFGDRISIMDSKYVDGDELQELIDSPFDLTPPGGADAVTSGARYDYTLRSPQGVDLGVGQMSLYDDGTAVLDTFTRLPHAEGTKLGEQMLRDVIPVLENSGFHTIRGQAVDDGPWVWGKQGFVMDTSRTDEVLDWLDHLDGKLDELDESILPPPRVTFQEVDEADFTEAITAARQQERGGQNVGLTVYQYPPEEYRNMRLFLSEDGLTGYAIKPDGDLVSVFNVGEGGLLPDIMNDALTQGARKLDAYDQDGFLPDRYSEYGFEEVSRDPWDPQYAPEGWDEAAHGTPDVVYMQRPEVLEQGSLFEDAAAPLQVTDAAGRRAAITDLRRRIKAARENPNAANLHALGDMSGPNWKALGEFIGGDWGSIPIVRGITNVPGSGHVTRIISPGLAQRIRSTAAGRFVGERMAPRHDMRRTRGSRAAERLYRSQERSEFAAQHAVDDNIGRMTKLQRAAQAELGDPELVNEILREAFEQVDDGLSYGPVGDPMTGATVVAKLDHEDLLRAEIMALRNEGLDATAEYLEVMADLRKAGDEAAVRAGLPEDFLREGYFPRIMTQAGEQASRHNQDIIHKFGLDPKSNVSIHEQMFHRAREWNADMTIDAANETARMVFDLEDGVKLFEDDPLVAFALRSKSSFTAAAQMDMLDELVTLTDDTNSVFAAWGRDSLDFNETAYRRLRLRAKNDRINLVEVNTPRGPLYTTPEVAKEIENIRHIMYNDEVLEHTRSVIDRWSQIWGTYATVPIADGLGFHMRNAYGNVMLNLMAGVTNPEVYFHAARLQNASMRARRRMGSVGDEFAGMSFDEIIEHESLGLSLRDRNLLRGARQRGVIGDGFFQDLAPDELDNVYRAVPRGRTGEVMQQAGDKLLDNPIVRRGRAIGTAVENNARLAHYIDRINKGFSAENAAASVRRYLFDYGDLTPFERRHFRSISRFYTFMRKNTAVQTWAMMHNPAGMGRQMRAHRAMLPGDDEEGNELDALIPDYAREQGIIGTGFMSGNAMAPESVFNAALEPYNAAWKVLDQIPGLKEVLPGETEGGDAATSVLGLLSGGPMSLLEFLYETQSGQTWYGASTEDRGTEGDLMRFADALLPLWGPVDRMVAELSGGALEGTGGIWGLGNNPTSTQSDMSLGAALIKNLLGWNVVPLGEGAERSVIYGLSAELDAILEDAKARGVDIGTQADLRKLGILPELPDIAADIGLSSGRAPSLVLREQLEAQGIDPMTDEDYLEQLDKEERLGYDIVTRAEIEAWSEQAGVSPEQTVALVEDLEGRYTTRETRGAEYAREMGWTRPDEDDGTPNAIVDFRTKAHYNASNPLDPFTDDDGNVITMADWQAWVEDKGVRYFDEPDEDGNIYDTRSMRADDLALSIGLVNDEGEPLDNNLTRAYYNLQNPDDLITNRDGEPITYRDVDVVMPGSKLSDVRDWAIEQGYEINPRASSLPKDVRQAFNAAHPGAEYHTPRDWIQAGFNPVQGVYQWRVDGQVYEYWPDGMSENNWWIPGTTGTSTGRSALGAQEGSGGLLSGILGSD